MSTPKTSFLALSRVGFIASASKVGVDDPGVVQLTGVYHNLLRRWADV